MRSVNEDVLAELAEPRCVHDLFGWLRQLSFVEAGPAGLSLQEPIRRLMRADLQWRNPVRHAALLLRAREYHVARLQEARGRQADALLSSYLDLARSGADDGARDHDPFDDPPQVTAARRDDHPAILEMTRETEGPVAAERISRWLKVLPGGFLVVRTRRITPIGFLLEVPLRPAGSLDDIGDAALRGVLIDLARGDLLREGEQATFVGAWMTRSNHQCPDDIGRFLLLHPLKRAPAGRAPAVTYFAFVDARWADPMLAVGATRVPAADFAVGGVARTVWRHDWRRSAPRAWLDAIAGFDPLDQGMTSGPVARTVAPLLGREDFVAAVRRALRDLRNTTALEDSPLLRSRIVHEHAGEAGSPTASLVALIESAAAALRSSPKRMKLHRALHRTYLDPAETQEQAAELLGLPFSTYRRHLRAAISHVADALWRSELGGRAGDR